jgi:hypothetical protein
VSEKKYEGRKRLIEKGDKFGHLTADDKFVGLKTRATCTCVCGQKKSATVDCLVKGISTSCGCKSRMLLVIRTFKHGMVGTSEYKRWDAMIQRCCNPNNKGYKDYGGRGITVCRRWRRDFREFLGDMGKCPGPGYELERKNNDKGYSKRNCRWATRSEQARNKRNNLYITWNGETLIISEWARRTGLTQPNLSYRYAMGLRPPELFKPLIKRRSR